MGIHGKHSHTLHTTFIHPGPSHSQTRTRTGQRTITVCPKLGARIDPHAGGGVAGGQTVAIGNGQLSGFITLLGSRLTHFSYSLFCIVGFNIVYIYVLERVRIYALS